MDNPRLKGIVERFAVTKQVVDEKFSDKYQIFINYILLKEIYYQINEEYPYESFFNISLLEDINFWERCYYGYRWLFPNIQKGNNPSWYGYI